MYRSRNMSVEALLVPLLCAVGLSALAACGDAVVGTHPAGGCSDTSSSTGGSNCPCGADECGACYTDCTLCNALHPCPTDYDCVHTDEKCGEGTDGSCVVRDHPPCPSEPMVCTCEGAIVNACGSIDISSDPSRCTQN